MQFCILKKIPFEIGALNIEDIGLKNDETLLQLRRDIISYFIQDNESIRTDYCGNKQSFEINYEILSMGEFYKKISSSSYNYFKTLLSEELKKDILKNLWKNIIFNRKDHYFLELLLFGLFNIDFFKTRIELSFMPNGSYIVPHTDSKRKIFSGLIYLPSIEQECNDKLGTSFWDCDVENIHNKHLEDTESKTKFYSTASLIYRPNFESCKMYYFLRNSKSWHSVEKVDLKTDEYRISINYNITIEKTIIRSLFHPLVSLIKKNKTSTESIF